ncbi:hypothetical protein K443DRAFT_162646 [Laccaria amethystina LaAM-08-1]|uniref:Secreted protein n=1 Tax=Laccaria amethystina LaAM-08-1 TaxID=1095629 RepID=A0A0C9WGJ7_9AGAR|nr:hypothetical protein K443DRAFT_162646 [Laccaria amethystina LaAM-08-1]
MIWRSVLWCLGIIRCALSCSNLCVFLPYPALLSLGCMPPARSTCTSPSRLIPPSSIVRKFGLLVYHDVKTVYYFTS